MRRDKVHQLRTSSKVYYVSMFETQKFLTAFQIQKWNFSSNFWKLIPLAETYLSLANENPGIRDQQV